MIRLVRDMISRYFKNDVSRSGVVLAYFLLFSIFPMLISINALLGAMDLNDGRFILNLKSILPPDIVILVHSYLEYATSIQSPTILITGVFLTLFSLSRAVNALVTAVNRAYETEEHITNKRAFVRSVTFTCILGTSFIVTMFILVAGRGLLSEIALYSGTWLQFVEIWNAARFAVLGVFIFAALSLLYYMLPAEKQTVRQIFPGTFFALICWVGMTAGFSYYVTHLADYSRIYGSLGVIIMLMFWLYLTGVVLILGGELNAALLKRKNKQKKY